MDTSGTESPQPWRRLDPTDGELLIHTEVTGRAARMGHRLIIAMTSWHAEISFNGNEPTAAELTVDVDSLHVLSGEGGVTPLSGREKSVVRANALECFDVRKYPHIRFSADTVDRTEAGYRLTGEVEIHGVTRPHTVDVDLAGPELSDPELSDPELSDPELSDPELSGLDVSCVTEVRQRAFGMRPYSMLMGAMKVADEVTVSFTAALPVPT